MPHTFHHCSIRSLGTCNHSRCRIPRSPPHRCTPHLSSLQCGTTGLGTQYTFPQHSTGPRGTDTRCRQAKQQHSSTAHHPRRQVGLCLTDRMCRCLQKRTDSQDICSPPPSLHFLNKHKSHHPSRPLEKRNHHILHRSRRCSSNWQGTQARRQWTAWWKLKAPQEPLPASIHVLPIRAQ